MTHRLTVFGTGYLGTTHAACMADPGCEVLGVDVDEAKVASLAEGQVPFFEPGLEDLLRASLATGRLPFTTSYEEAAAFADVHVVCAGTPQLPGSYAADVSHLDAVVTGLAPYLDRPCVVVGKSTVPVGTADRLVTESPASGAVELVWNPEFRRTLDARNALDPARWWAAGWTYCALGRP